MKKTLILLSLFLLLGGSAYYLINKKSAKTSHKSEDYHLYVEDTDQIYKIFLANRKGEKKTIERKDGYWVYNNRRVRQDKIKTFLTTLSVQRMKYIPPQAAVETAIKAIAARGIKVEIYGKNDDLINSFYVGGVTQGESGTYMIKEGSEQPVVMHIPSWDGNLRGRYWGKDIGWYDKRVFNYKKEDIQAVSVEYPRQKNKSFSLKRTENDFTISPFYKVTPVITRPYKKSSAEDFLDKFKSLSAEGFRNEMNNRDSISSLVPFCIVKLMDKSEQEFEVRFHTQSTEGIVSTKDGGEGGVIPRYYADCSNGDFMLVQHEIFENIFWSYEAFYL